MDVSVIIVNYNTYQHTCTCIESVIQFTKGVTYEIILVDNASTECDAELFRQKFPMILLIKSPVNSGFTGGNNLGIEKASGEQILLLNSDTELTEDSISQCSKFLKENSKVGVVSCKLTYPDGSIQKQCQRFPAIGRTLMELFRLHKLIPQPKRGVIMANGFFDHTTSIYCNSVWGTFFMFPKKVLSHFKNSKLPGEFFMYAEDLLWCYLIKQNGYGIYYNANTKVIHHMGGSFQPSVLKHKHRNEYAFLLKYRGWLYAKTLMLLRWMLYLTSGRNEYASEIRGLSFKLFLKGNAE